MTNIGDRLKYLRKYLLKLTQSELGEKIGVTGFTISDIEKGKRKLTDRNLTAICDKFNVNKDWLENGIGEPFKEISRKSQIMMWVADIMKEEDESYRLAFVELLTKLNREDWIAIAKILSLNLEKTDIDAFIRISNMISELNKKIEEQKKE